MSETKQKYFTPNRIIAMVILVAFFLPWVNIMGMLQYSGFNIPKAIAGLGQMATAFDDTSVDSWKIALVNIIYLIPIINIAILAVKKRIKALELSSSIFILVMFMYLLIKALTGADEGIDMSVVFNTLSIGVYLTFIGAISQLVHAIMDKSDTKE